MKRSSKISLILMTGTAMTVLAGCDNDDDNQVTFDNIDQCDAIFNHPQCLDLMNQDSPRPLYVSREDCVAALGTDQCVELTVRDGVINTSGHGWFMPAYSGFMFGQQVNGVVVYHYVPYPVNISPLGYGTYRDRYGAVLGGQPYVYGRSYSSMSSSPWGRASMPTVARSGGTTSIGKTAFAASVGRSAVSARGGFGGGGHGGGE